MRKSDSRLGVGVWNGRWVELLSMTVVTDYQGVDLPAIWVKTLDTNEEMLLHPNFVTVKES